jgi:hypothetical protein
MISVSLNEVCLLMKNKNLLFSLMLAVSLARPAMADSGIISVPVAAVVSAWAVFTGLEVGMQALVGSGAVLGGSGLFLPSGAGSVESSSARSRKGGPSESSSKSSRKDGSCGDSSKSSRKDGSSGGSSSAGDGPGGASGKNGVSEGSSGALNGYEVAQLPWTCPMSASLYDLVFAAKAPSAESVQFVKLVVDNHSSAREYMNTNKISMGMALLAAMVGKNRAQEISAVAEFARANAIGISYEDVRPGLALATQARAAVLAKQLLDLVTVNGMPAYARGEHMAHFAETGARSKDLVVFQSNVNLFSTIFFNSEADHAASFLKSYADLHGQVRSHAMLAAAVVSLNDGTQSN